MSTVCVKQSIQLAMKTVSEFFSSSTHFDRLPSLQPLQGRMVSFKPNSTKAHFAYDLDEIFAASGVYMLGNGIASAVLATVPRSARGFHGRVASAVMHVLNEALRQKEILVLFGKHFQVDRLWNAPPSKDPEVNDLHLSRSFTWVVGYLQANDWIGVLQWIESVMVPIIEFVEPVLRVVYLRRYVLLGLRMKDDGKFQMSSAQRKRRITDEPDIETKDDGVTGCSKRRRHH